MGFIARSTAELKGQYLGQAASRIAQSFETARANSPSILFIDEIDALTVARGGDAGHALQAEALTQLLQEMDGGPRAARIRLRDGRDEPVRCHRRGSCRCATGFTQPTRAPLPA